MKTAEIKATLRQKTGAKSAAQARRQERIPAVVYGEGGVQHVEIDYRDASKLIHSPDLYLINLDMEGSQRRVIIKDTQFHPLSDKILHVDFLEAAVGKTAILSIPVHIVGNSVGVLNGGQLVVKTRKLNLRGIPAELPEYVDVDITNLEIGKSIKAGDIKGFDIVDAANVVIVRVKTARALEEIAPVVTAEAVEPAEGAGDKEGGEDKDKAEEGKDK